MTKLMIVESPAKVKKLAGFLGDGWKVDASLGHVRDLPEDDLGVTIPDAFRPDYRILPKKEGVVRRLVKAMKTAEAVYLATDPDREGEAIAWHLLELAKLPPGIPVYRITFNAITASAVLDAVKMAHSLDSDLVEAQQARRVIDRLVGYLASALTCRALDGRFSAGRVQSVCLRLVVEREREIQAFTPHPYWTLAAALDTPDGRVQALLTSIKGVKQEQLTQEQIDGLATMLTGSAFWVSAVEQDEKKRPPAPPFTTASLQQAASKALKLSPDQTMRLAQVLYEAGLITYMRTDGVTVAPEAQSAARAFITQQYGAAYVPDQPPTYEARMDHAQEAHEAIRPVDATHLPDQLGNTSDGPGTQLYTLIWKRFIASQMAVAHYQHARARILAGKTVGTPYPLEFTAQGRRLVFEGFLKVYEEALDDGEEAEDEPRLPALSDGLTLRFAEWIKDAHTTKAPGRYTEAALVQALETRGIGRPSTFASMVKLIKDKGYVKLDHRRLIPTPTGLTLCDFLVAHFPQVFESSYTARLEDQLDAIALGKTTRFAVLTAFWNDFDPALKAVGKIVEQKILARQTPQPTGQNCPKCGKPLVERRAKTGPFAGCSGYPACTFSTAITRFTGAKAR